MARTADQFEGLFLRLGNDIVRAADISCIKSTEYRQLEILFRNGHEVTVNGTVDEVMRQIVGPPTL